MKFSILVLMSLASSFAHAVAPNCAREAVTAARTETTEYSKLLSVKDLPSTQSTVVSFEVVLGSALRDDPTDRADFQVILSASDCSTISVIQRL